MCIRVAEYHNREVVPDMAVDAESRRSRISDPLSRLVTTHHQSVPRSYFYKETHALSSGFSFPKTTFLFLHGSISNPQEHRSFPDNVYDTHKVKVRQPNPLKWRETEAHPADEYSNCGPQRNYQPPSAVDEEDEPEYTKSIQDNSTPGSAVRDTGAPAKPDQSDPILLAAPPPLPQPRKRKRAELHGQSLFDSMTAEMNGELSELALRYVLLLFLSNGLGRVNQRARDSTCSFLLLTYLWPKVSRRTE